MGSVSVAFSKCPGVLSLLAKICYVIAERS